MTAIFLAADLAARLGCSAAYVRRHWRMWAETAGFPRPLPISETRPRWDAEAVEIWLQRQRPDALRTRDLAPGPANDDDDPARVVARRLADAAGE